MVSWSARPSYITDRPFWHETTIFPRWARSAGSLAPKWGMIKLSVSRKGDQLLFAIEDDGVGRSSPKRMASMGDHDPADAPTKKTSLGTAITKARLDLVRQQKGKAAGFVYVDLPQGTRVELTLPFSTAA